jgi:hypothetical protein
MIENGFEWIHNSFCPEHGTKKEAKKRKQKTERKEEKKSEPKKEAKKRSTEPKKKPKKEAKKKSTTVTLNQWYAMAGEKNLWLTMNQLNKIPPWKTVELAVGVDNGSTTTPIAEGFTYTAASYFGGHKRIYQRTPGGGCVLNGVQYPPGINPFSNRGLNDIAGIGEDMTASMLWSELIKLPDIVHYMSWGDGSTIGDGEESL